MIKINVNQVIEINKTVISKTGGTFTILNENLLEQSVNSIYQTFDGNELYPNILDKASQICYSLCKNHCFEDGNKRTARLISNMFYQEKGLPYVIVPVKDWDTYVDAWSNDDISEYNSMMNRLVIDSYQYFYGNQTTNKAALFTDDGQKIITSKRKQ